MNGQFLTPSFNFRNSKLVAAATTLTGDDEEVQINGAYTMTLPSIISLYQDGKGDKAYKIYNYGGSTVTISSDALDTIEDGSAAGATSVYLYDAADYIIIAADLQKRQWRKVWPKPAIDGSQNLKDASVKGHKMIGGKIYGAVTVDTNGTTAVNVFGSAGAPDDLTLTGISAIAKDTVAGNITLTNGTSAVSTFAKSTTAGVVVGEDGALTYYSVTAADTVTVASSATNANGRCTVTFTMP